MNEDFERDQLRGVPDTKAKRDNGGFSKSGIEGFLETRLPKTEFVTIRKILFALAVVGGYDSILSKAKDFYIDQARLTEYRLKQAEDAIKVLQGEKSAKTSYESAPDYKPPSKRYR